MSAMKICPQCGTEYELDQRFCPKDGSTLKSQSNPSGDLLGQIVADRYHIMKKLGEGGMGTVYLAEHVKMGRKSAVKVMNPGMVNDADAISRFNREAANASRINHPNVAAVYDFGETSDGLIYLAMEFIEGPSLTKVIEEQGALPAQRAADITRQAGEALAVAHDMGIVHRDLKPDNIMIAKGREGQDIVKVVDFGIAKAANNDAQKVTKTGLVVGTPEYMSPEQLAGDKLDGRSDTYSLGLVAFNMMTGKLPFPAETVQESMIMRLTDTPRPLSEMRPEVAWTPEVQAVMDKALARDAVDRYQTASEFGRDLVKAVEGMPESELTNAFTAVMTPVSAGKTAAQAPAPKPATPGRAVPPTRIGASTPPQSVPGVVPTPAGSRMPMMIAAGVIAVAVLGGGAYLATKGNAAPNDNGATLAGSTAAAPPSAAPINLDSALAAIEKLADVATATPVMAAEALQKLDSLNLTRATVDQQVLAALVRGEAHAVRENSRAACDAVKNVEGQSVGTQYEQRVRTILDSAC